MEKVMIRIKIQLTEEQAARVKELSRSSNESIARLIRRAVASFSTNRDPAITLSIGIPSQPTGSIKPTLPIFRSSTTATWIRNPGVDIIYLPAAIAWHEDCS